MIIRRRAHDCQTVRVYFQHHLDEVRQIAQRRLLSDRGLATGDRGLATGVGAQFHGDAAQKNKMVNKNWLVRDPWVWDNYMGNSSNNQEILPNELGANQIYRVGCVRAIIWGMHQTTRKSSQMIWGANPIFQGGDGTQRNWFCFQQFWWGILKL